MIYRVNSEYVLSAIINLDINRIARIRITSSSEIFVVYFESSTNTGFSSLPINFEFPGSFDKEKRMDELKRVIQEMFLVVENQVKGNICQVKA